MPETWMVTRVVLALLCLAALLIMATLWAQTVNAWLVVVAFVAFGWLTAEIKAGMKAAR